MKIVTVDYQEWKPETYKGIVVSDGWGSRRVFTGDFKADYAKVVKQHAPFQKSSSVDHYMMDLQ